MNKFEAKISLLKEAAEECKTRYFDIKKEYDLKQHESTQKEYELKALTAKNTFLTDTIHTHTTNFAERAEGVRVNTERIAVLEESIRLLTAATEALEAQYDDLTAKFAVVKEELREFHQLLDGV